jgi:predicted NUDIX family NTP pyrophosphohydrolase
MPSLSAGLLMHRLRPHGLQVLLVHPGGPFWKNKDAGAWSIPKGTVEEGEEPLAAGRREFEEETGLTSAGPYLPLSPVKYKGGKVVHAWSFEGDCDPASLKSNTFEMEWPKGKRATFPEIDKAEWFNLAAAREKILPAQVPFLDELEKSIVRQS